MARTTVKRWLPLVFVAATCAASLVLLRAGLTEVPYLNDLAVHEETVAAALSAMRHGQFPPGTWFSQLNLGSPQLLHDQPLAAMLTAVLAWPIGVGRAFTLTTWLLVCCWPMCVYGAARVFQLSSGAACAAALLSPFLSSATGVGYEQISYLWIGYGLWSQLWAMWTLPFALACSWRSMEQRRFVAPAAILVAVTAAFHFETGYLAFAGVLVFVVVRPSDFVRRAGRGLLVAFGALALSAWAVVPLVAQGKWAAINEFLQSGPAGVDANSYGARRVLSWLVDGDLLDWHHLVLITPLCAIGLFCSVTVRWHRSVLDCADSRAARALVVLFLVFLGLFFGRPTLGPLLDLVPGSKDLFLRRFLVGVQLTALFLAGIGAAELARGLADGIGRTARRLAPSRRQLHGAFPTLVIACSAIAALVPAWSFLVDEADHNAAFIARQAAAVPAARSIKALVTKISDTRGGRVFAGDPFDGWGQRFTVGEVPVFKYLASKGVDEVGFTLRTASLMSGPEEEFDETDPADYALFGVHWLLLPAGMPPPVPATLVEQRGQFALFELSGNGEVQVVDTRGMLAASSVTLATSAVGFLSDLPVSSAVYPTVAYGTAPGARGTLPIGARPSTPAGRVLSERPDLACGSVTATVVARRTAVVLLSASFDPGWQAIVDGRTAATEMVAPALVGVRVGPGKHTVQFVYHGFPDYPQLFLLGLFAFVALLLVDRHTRKNPT